jgi:hypothetical protein
LRFSRSIHANYGSQLAIKNNPNMALLKVLEEDVNEFARTLNRVLSNERDLQVRLAMYLKDTKHYDEVEVEYAIPLSLLELKKPDEKNVNGVESELDEFEGKKSFNFPWPNDIYFDIVVYKNREYAIVELKYATKKISDEVVNTLYSRAPIKTRFGVSVNEIAMKNQRGQNLIMYRYCKDIRRIEYLCGKNWKEPQGPQKNMPTHIVGGIALLITNDHLYWTKPQKKDAAYQNFSLDGGKEIQDVSWHGNSSHLDDYPNFSLAYPYTCTWKNTAWNPANGNPTLAKDGSVFRYLLTVIPPSSNGTSGLPSNGTEIER